MNKPTMKIRHNKLSMAIAGALMLSASAANALLIEDSITASAEASVPGQTPITDSDTDATFASAIASTSNFPDFASANAFGRDTGRYLASVNGEERGSATASFSWTRKITNDEADPLDIFLDVYLYGGGLNIGSIGQVAGYSWDIVANGPDGSETLLDSDVEINGTAIVDPENDGLSDSAFNSPFNYNWSSEQLLSGYLLGRLEAGEMLTIQYDLTTYIDGENLTTAVDCYGGEYGGGIDEVFTVNLLEESRGCFMNTFTGDPNSVSTDPIPGGSVQITSRAVGNPNDIPEPTSLLLLGAGAVGAAAARRKSKKRGQ